MDSVLVVGLLAGISFMLTVSLPIAYKAHRERENLVTGDEQMSEPVRIYLGLGNVRLDDSGQWINRFTVPSSSSAKGYIVSQHKENRWWGCSCTGWKTHRKCKHLTALGLPNHEQSIEAMFIDLTQPQITQQFSGSLEMGKVTISAPVTVPVAIKTRRAISFSDE